jgi:myo-inositol 2-dehydrogenase/D-chiro-inositol 1-dehydrogenase
LRLGLIGGGRIGTVHAETLAALPGVETLTIADQVPAVAAAVAASVGAEVVDPVDEVFDVVDAVVIASPTDTHVEYLLRACKARLPAFCEKPIAMDLSETDRAIEAVREAGIPVQMGFQRRFDPGYRAAHDLVASGALGEVLLVTGHTHDPEPSPEEYVARSGGVFKDMLIHDIDILHFVTGRRVEEVLATGSNRTMELYERYQDLATVAVTARMDDGALSVLSGSRRDPIGYDVRMEVFGTKDSIAVGLDSHSPIRSVEAEASPPAEPVTVGWLERFRAAYRAEMDAFLHVAAGEAHSESTVEDARDALVVAEACGTSAREERWVRVEENR